MINSWCDDRNKADDLASYMVDKLYSGSKSVDSVIVQGNGPMEEWCKRLIYMSLNNNGSEFSRINRRSHVTDEVLDGLTSETTDPEYYFRSFLESELTKDGWEEHRIDMILRLQKMVSQLNPWQSQLFDLYFVQNLSHRKIAEIKGIPKTNVNYMVVELKQQIESILGIALPRKARRGSKRMEPINLYQYFIGRKALKHLY